MTFETNKYSYFTDPNQSQCDMEYNIPDFNSYTFGSPTYSSSSSSNHSAMESAILDDDTLPDRTREPYFIKNDFTERPLLTPPSRSRFQKIKTSSFVESDPYSQSIMHPYCYSLPPLTCYSIKCDAGNRHRSKTYQKVLTGAPRRYQCTVCVKRFTRPSSLATHMYSHTGEKPYQCEVEGCGRRFSVVSNLRRHAKIHLQPS